MEWTNGTAYLARAVGFTRSMFIKSITPKHDHKKFVNIHSHYCFVSFQRACFKIAILKFPQKQIDP
jgi:hypothetical protein